ncbi:MAG: TolB family protein [Kofleriaceae bacterium]
MRAGLLVLIAGCFDPSVTAGAPCGANDTCPADLVCTGGFCVRPGAGADARDDAPIDSPPNDAPTDMMMAMGWATPVSIAELNTQQRDSDPAITANGLELFFSSTRSGGMGGDDIYYTRRATTSDPWETPTNLTVLSSASSDLSVEITGDGQHVWFQSLRSGMGDIYTSNRVGLGWSPPELVTELSSPTEIEADFGVSPDGLTVIVSRGDLGSRVLYIASRPSVSSAWSTLARLDDINNAADDPSAPSLTNGASIVYFHADPVRNIYVSTKVGASYTAPVPVSEVNTAQRDGCPYAPQANDVMYFERAGDLYATSR